MRVLGHHCPSEAVRPIPGVAPCAPMAGVRFKRRKTVPHELPETPRHGPRCARRIPRGVGVMSFTAVEARRRAAGNRDFLTPAWPLRAAERLKQRTAHEGRRCGPALDLRPARATLDARASWTFASAPFDAAEVARRPSTEQEMSSKKQKAPPKKLVYARRSPAGSSKPRSSCRVSGEQLRQIGRAHV